MPFNNCLTDGEQLFMWPPVLLYISHIEAGPEWYFPRHTHKSWSEIAILTGGRGRFIINGRIFSAQKGDVLVFNQNTIHEEYSAAEDPLRMYSIGVGRLCLVGADAGCVLPNDASPLLHTGELSAQCEKYGEEMLREMEKQDWGHHDVCTNGLSSLIYILYRLYKKEKMYPPAEQRLESLGEKLRNYLDGHYQERITLDSLSDIFHFSPCYLAHAFKKNTGETIMGYLIRRRMLVAREMLLSTDISIREISFMSGYENQLYFSTVFKKHFSCAPGAFRKGHKMSL